MQVDLLSLVNSTRGHYQFESGYHGDTRLDLEGLFVRLSAHKIDAVCGPVTGGAFTDAPRRRPGRGVLPLGTGGIVRDR